MLHVDRQHIDPPVPQPCLTKDDAQWQAIGLELHRAIVVNEDLVLRPVFVDAIWKDLASTVALQECHQMRVGLHAHASPPETSVKEHRVAVLEGHARAHINVHASAFGHSSMMVEEVPISIPILAELRNGGVGALVREESRAVQWQHVRVLQQLRWHPRHASPGSAIAPTHQDRLLPHRVQKMAGWARLVSFLSHTTVRDPSDNHVLAQPRLHPIDRKSWGSIREDHQVTERKL
mmetsp:Transcript_143404/g.357294  ORF Transcript_143404/g.357294 Transcript_143404/m.357294 type:complete len:234 (+) Transcript_143404:396-1097(+)